MTIDQLALPAFGLWLMSAVWLLIWGLLVVRPAKIAVLAMSVSALAAAALPAATRALLPRLERFAIRRAFSEKMHGPPPLHAFSVDDGRFWYDDVGYLVGGAPAPTGKGIALDLKDVWWSDGETHVVPRDQTVVIPMATCDICKAYPLGDGWWFLWLNN